MTDSGAAPSTAADAPGQDELSCLGQDEYFSPLVDSWARDDRGSHCCPGARGSALLGRASAVGPASSERVVAVAARTAAAPCSTWEQTEARETGPHGARGKMPHAAYAPSSCSCSRNSSSHSPWQIEKSLRPGVLFCFAAAVAILVPSLTNCFPNCCHHPAAGPWSSSAGKPAHYRPATADRESPARPPAAAVSDAP